MALRYPHIIPKVENWPINKIAKQRGKFISELNELVANKLQKSSSRSLEDILAKTIYLETQRTKSTPWKVDPQDDALYWKKMGTSLAEALKSADKEVQLKKLLDRIINRYNEEIVGSFNPKTFLFARRFLTLMFKMVYNKFNAKGQSWFWGSKKNLLEKIKIIGHVDETRALFDKGTVVIVPTHFSNLDSIMIGYMMDMLAGLPQFSYGAGLNLFNHEMVAYFINRLGAYRIDRRKKNPVYLECLTSMAAYSLTYGVNNIFFPGGTRSRSGALEDKLKYGLLSSAIDAQRLLFEANKKDKIYIVPLVMSYNFVFEAKSLIDQHLMAIGKEKYQRIRDTKKGFSKWKFFKLFFKKESEVIFSFGEPMDVIGNFVNENGESIDKNCNVIELSEYFMIDNKLEESTQRESVYTRILAEKVLDSYFRNNVVLASHLVAHVAFNMLVTQRKDLDLFAILRLNPREFVLSYTDFKGILSLLLDHMKRMEEKGEIHLSRELYGDIDHIISFGLDTLGAYHVEQVLGTNMNRATVYSENLKLLHFYANRLNGYGFENIIAQNWTEKFIYIDNLKNIE